VRCGDSRPYPQLTGALAMKVLLWIVAIIVLIGLAVVLGVGGLIF
jgi:hypothetical protein